MPGSPFTLSAADPNLCWATCNTTQGCLSWAYAIPNCDGFSQPTCWLKGSFIPKQHAKCRDSGEQAGAPDPGQSSLAAASVYSWTAGPSASSAYIVISIDEILSIDWFGEKMPPYWRRALTVGSLEVPVTMLANSFNNYEAVKMLCDNFDVDTDKV